MTIGNLSQDRNRFQRLLREKAKEKKDLTDFLTHEDIIGRQGSKKIRISVPYIDIPRFKYDLRGRGGVAQGEGKIGDKIGDPFDHQGKNDGQAGTGHGDNLYEVEFSTRDIGDWLLEYVGLPHLEPKGNLAAHAEKLIEKGVAESGRKMHFKRSYLRALRREVTSGTFDPNNPIIIPYPEDKRYKAYKTKPEKDLSAVIIYMLDVSGSMTADEKERCRIASYWMQHIFSRVHPNLEERFIVFTDVAKEVKPDIYYNTKWSGGTVISTPLTLCCDMIRHEYPLDQWNIYPVMFTDGENGSSDDEKAIAILGNQLLPSINTFSYAQTVKGSGRFLGKIMTGFNLDTETGDRMARRKIRAGTMLDKDDIRKILRLFLNKNRVPFYEAAEAA